MTSKIRKTYHPFASTISDKAPEANTTRIANGTTIHARPASQTHAQDAATLSVPYPCEINLFSPKSNSSLEQGYESDVSAIGHHYSNHHKRKYFVDAKSTRSPLGKEQTHIA